MRHPACLANRFVPISVLRRGQLRRKFLYLGQSDLGSFLASIGGCVSADSRGALLPRTNVMAGHAQPIDHGRNGGCMSATMTGISCITRAVDSTPSQGPLTHPAPRSVACRRCGGLLVDEQCMDLDIGPIGKGYWARRCIQCGDIIDETILRNRYAPCQTFREIGPAAGRGQAFTASPPHDGKGGRYATVYDASCTIRRHAGMWATSTTR
jgi:hypothetical protein